MIYNHNLSDRFEIIQIYRTYFFVCVIQQVPSCLLAFFCAAETKEFELKTFLIFPFLWSTKFFSVRKNISIGKMPKEQKPSGVAQGSTF